MQAWSEQQDCEGSLCDQTGHKISTQSQADMAKCRAKAMLPAAHHSLPSEAKELLRDSSRLRQPADLNQLGLGISDALGCLHTEESTFKT